MSHEITNTDGMVLVGKPAWHGLGVVLPQGPLDPREARRLAGLEWGVREAPLFAHERGRSGQGPAELSTLAQDGTIGRGVPVTTHKAIIREDTGDMLGVVGADFHPVQNGELFDLLQALGRDVETAGSLRGGRVVFALLKQGEFQVGIGDRVHQYLLASNGHDGSRALAFTPTDVRVVCANTLARADAQGTGVRLLHTKGLAERLRAASATLERAEALVSVQRAETMELVTRVITEDEFDAYLARTVEDVRGMAPGSIQDRDPLRRYDLVPPALRARVQATAESLVAALEHPTNQLPGMDGTAWQAYQAVSYWAQHVRNGRMDAPSSNLAGPIRDIKARAWTRALELARG